MDESWLDNVATSNPFLFNKINTGKLIIIKNTSTQMYDNDQLVGRNHLY